MTSASLLIVVFVGTVVGAVTGLVVSASFGAVHLAILAGFLGAMAGVVIRNFILAKGAGVGPDDSKTPTLVVIYATVASLAGLFLAVLLSMLMISYHTTPGEQPKVKKKQ